MIWGALIVGAAALRFYEIGASSLWNDEGTTWALVQRPVAEIVRSAAADIHPPLFYLLLHLWAQLLGASAESLRAFSALCGTALVAVTGGIAATMAGRNASRAWLPLMAALWVALNPFQVYYSQEARMYMLLALEAGLLLWIVLAMMRAEEKRPASRQWFLWTAYVLVATAGMWTHYSFPIVVAAALTAYTLDWVLRRCRDVARWGQILRFAFLNGLVVIAFAPWLPTAWWQVTSWPQGGEEVALVDGLVLTVRTLLFGPIRSAPEPAWGWVALGMVLPVMGTLALRRNRRVWAVVLALALPVALMFALGLFSDAFLKFLLVASLPWCILIAACSEWGLRPALTVVLRLAVAGTAVALAAATLPGYYADPAARDNYLGVAAWLRAMADPAQDVVLLDAPGQQDVWSYYDPGLPVLALPRERPAQRATTETALAQALEGKRAAYALFWATDEADPDGIVEGWMNQHWYRGMESWQGNVRLVEYLAPQELECSAVDQKFGEAVSLDGVCLPPSRSVESGRPFAVALKWRSAEPLQQNIKVSVQMVNDQGQVLAQHDGEPAGGDRPTSTWQVGETIEDRHALLVPIGTPTGPYRLLVVLYDAATGARLATAEGDSYSLGALDVYRTGDWPPVDVLPIQHRLARSTGPVQLLGYDLYKQGFAHARETPLAAGDRLHVTLYWQAPDPLPVQWPQDEGFTFTLGAQSLTAPLAIVDYPTREWSPGEIVRADFDIVYDGARGGLLRFGDERVRIGPVPQ